MQFSISGQLHLSISSLCLDEPKGKECGDSVLQGISIREVVCQSGSKTREVFIKFPSVLHENNYSATLGERKKAPTIIAYIFIFSSENAVFIVFSLLNSAFLCFSLLFSVVKKRLQIPIISAT
jgi:hypothetical protein